MTWMIIRSDRFKDRYKQKTPKQQAQVDEALTLLVQSKDPRILARPKQGKLRGCYGHDIDFHNRILFSLDLAKHEIHFHRVCSHEEVYGVT